jgi:Flp pilus assembly pilin Flp
MVDLSNGFRKMKAQSGQALVEYALILVLLAIMMAVTLAATGPAIANVFSNVICNVAGQNRTTCAELDPLNTAGGPNPFWATVTWVAANPQFGTLVPTPPIQPPTLEPTIGSSLPTNTSPPTETPVPTSTIGPSATPADEMFPMTFTESGNTLTNWRLFGNSVYLGGDEWVGRYYPSNNFTGTPTVVGNIAAHGVANALNIDFNWGANAPITTGGWTRTDNISIRWVRSITIPAGQTRIRFSTTADSGDTASLYVCPSQAAAQSRSGCTSVFTNQQTNTTNYTVSPGAVLWLAFEYIEYSGNASIRFNMNSVGGLSPDDQVATNGECTWGQISNSNVNTRDWMFDENPASDTFAAGQTCYLELRGWVDTAGSARPVLSFWDVWDLPANTTAALQVGEYNSNRTLINWRTISLHTGGTNVRNYEWTRYELPLSSITPALTGTRLAIRFRLQSTGSGSLTPVRWYLDDIVVKPTPEVTFTVGNGWNLNGASQANDFITTGRWSITNTRTHGGSSFEDSAASNYDRHSQGNPRIHYIEPAGRINLGTGTPATDAEGDAGAPMLSFWHAYQIAPQSRIEVQYTFDALDTTPDTWITIPTGTGTPPLPGGSLVNNTGSTNITDLVMKRVQIRFDQIPNWNTQTFRIRFALIVNGTATADGWWIDDIQIERFGGDRFVGYPFVDGAEDLAFTDANWLRMGTWGQAAGGSYERLGGGFFQTGRSYADSPTGNFNASSSTSMEMTRHIDLLYDTPANTGNVGGVGEAVPSAANIAARRAANARPTLTFWHRRDVRAGSIFAVDITTTSLADNNPASDAEWRTIWTYTAPGSNPNTFERWTQNSWERVEIDLRVALEQALASTWATISTATTTLDDDIRIRFRLNTGSNTANGIFIDDIRIEDLQLPNHRLWGSSPAAGSVGATQSLGAGNGVLFEDFIETASPTSLGAVYQRWYMSGTEWNAIIEDAAVFDSARSGTLSLHDSLNSSTSYANDSFVVAEMATVIDLRGVTAAQNPTLYFWQRYRTSGSDNFRVQVSAENTSSTTQQLGRVAGWGAWTNLADTPYNEMGQNINRQNWQRQQMLLNAYVGQRIRIRWVVDASNSSNNADGWYVDNVSLGYNGSGAGRTTPIPMPFFDDAQNMANWIAEGQWGLGGDYVRGATASAELGSDVWRAYYMSCRDRRIAADGSNCSSEQTILNVMDRIIPRPTAASVIKPNYTTLVPAVPWEDTADINYYWPEAPMNNTLSGNTPNYSYEDQWSARFMREVQLVPGTYTFRIVLDDGVRIHINDRAGTTLTNTSNLIYDNWFGGEGPTNLYTAQLTVTQAINRIFTVDYLETGGPGTLIVTIERDRYAFTDSPNTQAANGNFTIVNGRRPARTSLITNGYFNTSAVVAPTLQFYWMATQNDTALRVQTSTDGGFTWTQQWETTWQAILPYNDWQQAQVALPVSASVMIRFLWATNSASTDGAYITDISVIEP